MKQHSDNSRPSGELAAVLLAVATTVVLVIGGAISSCGIDERAFGPPLTDPCTQFDTAAG